MSALGWAPQSGPIGDRNRVKGHEFRAPVASPTAEHESSRAPSAPVSGL